MGADGDPKRGISEYFEGETGRLESGIFSLIALKNIQVALPTASYT